MANITIQNRTFPTNIVIVNNVAPEGYSPADLGWWNWLPDATYCFYPFTAWKLTEKWLDVTAQVTVVDPGTCDKHGHPLPEGEVWHDNHRLARLVCGGGYRIVKTVAGTIRIEKRAS